MKYAFFITLMILWLLSLIYSIKRGSQLLSENSKIKIIYKSLMIIGFLAFLSAMLMQELMPLPIAQIIEFIGYSYLILAAYLFGAFVFTDIISFLHKKFKWKRNIIRIRQATISLMLAAIIISMIIGNIKYHNPDIINLNIKSNKNINFNKNNIENKDLKIVAISDVHLGALIGKSKLKEYVEMINAQKPDIVLIAGDLVDRLLKPINEQNLHEELRQIKAPMGVFAVFGNHEYYGGDYGKDRKLLMDFYRKSNITLLRDSVAMIDSTIYIVGRDDHSNHQRKQLSALTKNLDNSKFIILLDHQPWELQEAEQCKVDLQLSGHTHAGQLFPGNLLIKNMYENPHGYSRRGNTQYYVSSGLGLWGPPYRIGTNSELINIRLSKAPSN